ncbi:MAG TPA: DUF1015 domain-containing protein, partial [Sediminispirochaeta sp.]|nr:DUF1015 domain-containing protein [Sediminispirochaeta sp.]
MANYEQKLADLGMKIPSILMPRKDVDLSKWAVVACDQFTSEPEYWEEVAADVGDAPSTLHLIYPEVYLNEADKDQRIDRINAKMDEYLREGILEAHEPALFLLRRDTPHSPSRWGVIAALDLERYDFSKDSTSLIRATEGTILDRIPPRKQIRKNAAVELPHIMVLVEDPQKTLIEALRNHVQDYEKVYDFDLMKDGGHLTGYKVDRPDLLENFASSLEKLADPRSFAERYGTEDVLLFAMGDGNHSLATAKSVWEDLNAANPKDPAIMEHPARWALVEIENIYDDGLVFEPIHRVVFDSDFSTFEGELKKLGRVSFKDCNSVEEVVEKVEKSGDPQVIGFLDSKRTGIFTIHDSNYTIAAGTTQAAIDALTEKGTNEVDYIHGLEATESLGRRKGNFGLILPSLDKSDFFKTVIQDGALPRKTFSMGEANEKRYYVEARKIKQYY